MGAPAGLWSLSEDEFRERRHAWLTATEEHRAVADRLLGLYRDEGLLPHDRDEALFCACRHREECWQGAPRPKNEHDAGIAMPWVGADYFNSRVLVLGLNLNNFGGLDANYLICLGHMKAMREGKRGKEGRAFSRNAMRYLRVILAGLDGMELPSPSDEVANEELGPLWDRCAFLERVKCAPGNARAEPTEAMVRKCPPFLAARELEILAPRVVLHLGRSNLRREWLVSEDGYGSEQGPHVERDRATIGDRQVELISVNHPSGHANHVAASLSQLVASVASDPIA